MSKSIKRIVFILCSLLLFLMRTDGQIVNFTSLCSNKGDLDQRMSIYGWSHWDKDTTSIVIDLTHEKINVGQNISYEMIEKPSKWVVKRTYKYCTFSCVDKWFNKVCIKLYVLDNCDNRFYVYVNEQSSSTKYLVKFIE